MIKFAVLKKEKKLKPAQQELILDNDIHEVYKRIRNFLAGRAIGITRDKALLHEVVKCLFCNAKLREAKALDIEPEQLVHKYQQVFAQIKSDVPHIFDVNEEINLDLESIAYVHAELSKVDLKNPQKDPLGELYQCFIGSDLRMAEGQFFTPHQAISWLVEAIDPKEGETIIDPACGPGGFLSYSARYLLNKGVAEERIGESLYGIEKDAYLANLAQVHLALATLTKSNIFCADSIEWTDSKNNPLNFSAESQFDIVLANPPFGAKIKSGSENKRRQFELAHKWRLNKDKGWTKTPELQVNTPPQILFMELCIKLLKPNGRMGIVVPESMVSNSSTSYVVEFIRKKCDILAVAGMPEDLFKTSGKGGTHTKTCLLIAKKKPEISSAKSPDVFIAEAKWCGHDSRGNSIPHNDLPKALKSFKTGEDAGNLGHWIPQNDIKDNILAPRYYSPTANDSLNALRDSHDIISVQELVDRGILSFSTGDEVGKLAYSTGDIPFVRTSDISSWEIKIDPKHCVSREVFDSFSKKQDVREGDVLMVRDGTYLIGACAYVSKYDEKIVYQSHLYKFRVHENDLISPFLLLALFSCEPVLQQIKSKRFTQDIIDSIGKRIFEVQLPIPKDLKRKNSIEAMVKKSIEDRVEARELARRAKLEIAS